MGVGLGFIECAEPRLTDILFTNVMPCGKPQQFRQFVFFYPFCVLVWRWAGLLPKN